MEGMRPRDPTRAAAASLYKLLGGFIPHRERHLRDDIAVKVGRDHHIEYPMNVLSGSDRQATQALQLTRAHGTSCCYVSLSTSKLRRLGSCVPVDGRVDELLQDGDIGVLASQSRDTADSFTEKTIGDGQNVGLVDDVQLLNEV